jgi:TolB-like protein
LDLGANFRGVPTSTGGLMTVGGRWAIAGLCATAGFLTTWAVYRSAPRVETLRVSSRDGETLAAPSLSEGSSVLWLLSIGVSRYEAPGLDLRFADVDARAIAASIREVADGRLYADVRTEVLVDEKVTRESILASMEGFLGEAGPNDVIVLFLAGHGVRDQASGSFYFLPYPATADNLVSKGLRMSDFDATLRVLRRNVRGVIVMLDTCHAGALDIPSARIVAADELAAQVSVGEGFFLLAATKPGEEATERPELGHGAFTYAVLEALRGAADADRSGVLTVSELFGYVARRVPILTLGEQHPYHKTEGTDLVFLEVDASEQPRAASPAPTEATTQPVRAEDVPSANTVGVVEFQNLRNDSAYEWISKALRVAFNTELSKVRALRVYSPELIDRTARARGFDYLFTAKQLGIGRLLTGSFYVSDHTLRIDAHIVDAASGVNEASDSVEGDLGSFFDLQKQLVLSMLRRLRVQVSAEEGASIQTENNTDVDAFRLLLESEGVLESERPKAPTPPATVGPQSKRRRILPVLAALLAAAYAQDVHAEVDSQVRQVLEAYRQDLERKDIEALAALYVSFSERQQKALRDYLDAAQDLHVEIGDVTITAHGEGVAASFTRRDRFRDRETGRPVRLEVRLTKILTLENDTWKIGGAE